MDQVSASSLSVYLAAVRQIHLQQGFPPPTVGDMPRLQQVLRRIKQAQARPPNPTSSQRSRLPITPTLLHTIWHSWSDAPLEKDKVMLWAAFTTCFFSFMRSGELCIRDTSKGFDETTDLTFEDVAMDKYQNLSLYLSYVFAWRHQKQILFTRRVQIFYWQGPGMSCVQ